MKIKNTRLGSKIFAFLAVTIMLLIVTYSLIFTKFYKRYEEELLGKESIKILHSLETSIHTIIRNADDYSKMLIADSMVQKQMVEGDLLADTEAQQQLTNRVYAILQFSDSADAIWLIDRKNQKFRVGGITSTSVNHDKELYSTLRVPYGRAAIMYENDRPTPTITLIRSYNNLSDFSSLGLIGVEISGKRIASIINEVIDLTTEQLLILDENGNIIFSSNPENEAQYIQCTCENKLTKKNDSIYRKVNVDKKDYMLTGIACSNRDWRIYRFAPTPNRIPDSDIFETNLYLIVFIGLFILLGTFLITQLLTKPIQQMIEAMEQKQDGVPEKIKVLPFLYEFRMLFNGYNSMVDRIKQLIKETIERQKRISQVELNEIQEQMKPHFLYNTLDSVEALALMGDSENVCKLIEALGGFYRKSVSGGREFLTIKEEIEMTRDYAKIMAIRFGDTFKCEITCDQTCEQYRIPKLTIQPLVENAFQHGIRGKITYGHIEVCAKQEGEYVHIMVNDNGDGIPKEVIKELEEGNVTGKKGSLGLKGTILRLGLVYGKNFKYEIGENGISLVHLMISVNALEEQSNEED